MAEDLKDILTRFGDKVAGDGGVGQGTPAACARELSGISCLTQ